MSTIIDNFSYEDFEKDNDFIKNLLFHKIYKKFEDEYIRENTAIAKCSQIENGLSIPYNEKGLILNFCKILQIIIAKDNYLRNELDNEIPEDYRINLDTFHTQNNIKCKYMDFLGKELKVYHESVNRCSETDGKNNYCKEFKEFQDIYKIGKIYWKNSTSDTEFHYTQDSTHNCPLYIESWKDPIRLIYKEANYTLHLSNQPMDTVNSSIISASSAIGTTVGISAFLLYLYKYTSLGSLFRHRIKKSNIIFDNMNTEAHNFTLPTSEIENSHFENSDYNISYYSLKNS
ncbi:PIR Superfamily Protein [Plasmodium ovale curtisi]|uniref:PIR Superfamily Protein n=1 Tax=Plasmodium ovale curtisi TaxID=864141 RepID=A0A1A8WS83_PLAOA|nr:PIR Superfamily Protein [Plasmodium ovale curtisi]